MLHAACMANWLKAEAARHGGIIWCMGVKGGLDVTLKADTSVSGRQCSGVNSVQQPTTSIRCKPKMCQAT